MAEKARFLATRCAYVHCDAVRLNRAAMCCQLTTMNTNATLLPFSVLSSHPSRFPTLAGQRHCRRSFLGRIAEALPGGAGRVGRRCQNRSRCTATARRQEACSTVAVRLLLLETEKTEGWQIEYVLMEYIY